MNICIIVALMLFSFIYIFDAFYHINKRIFFYENISNGIIYDIKIKEDDIECNNILEIVKTHQSSFDLADILFNNELYIKVPYNKIYNIVNEYTTYDEIYNTLNKYK